MAIFRASVGHCSCSNTSIHHGMKDLSTSYDVDHEKMLVETWVNRHCTLLERLSVMAFPLIPYAVEPLNKGHLRTSHFNLLKGCPLLGD